MTIGKAYKQFVESLSFSREEISSISTSYNNIASTLNRNLENNSATYQVGSYGRKTAIRSHSDLDMIYVMPYDKEIYDSDDGQRKLLTKTKDALKDSFPKTNIRVDRQIVSVPFVHFSIEVLPAFLNYDNSFTHADTYCNGTWCFTDPLKEIEAMNAFRNERGHWFRHLCKIMRAWKDTAGVKMSGYQLDALVYDFGQKHDQFNLETGFDRYIDACVAFWKYLSEFEGSKLLAPGSNSSITVEGNFIQKAKQAVNSIEYAKNDEQAWDVLRQLLGKKFPRYSATKMGIASFAQPEWKDTEEFIEDIYKVHIKYELEIDCKVTQHGFRTQLLSTLLEQHLNLLPRKELDFSVKSNAVPPPYELFWKVLNCGPEAQRRDQIRGQLHKDKGYGKWHESTKFRGKHVVSCYVVKDNVVVAADMIDVPINKNIEELQS